MLSYLSHHQRDHLPSGPSERRRSASVGFGFRRRTLHQLGISHDVDVAIDHIDAKEWAEIFLNSNYLAGIRQRGINGGTRSIRFQRCVLEAQVISSRQALHKPTGAI
ncbi:TBC1 domain family member 5 isoform X1 [Labeo rohita]|uniref:TBC1 domain family member 5 isoform X1 n=1 Tax=Labeo rohita TaxID=84645 RepID=A0A498N204_LABRO|nr:TBC1 domain family member 5 isoform X1 [Labeo rohita]